MIQIPFDTYIQSPIGLVPKDNAGVRCFVSKSDMTSAFRNLGVLWSQWRWLVMKAESPLDGKTYYFIDKYLPFGASISCALFQAFSDAIAHIMRVKSGKDNVNYLDDFLFVALLRAFCNAQIDLFLAICKRINFPVSIDKTFYGSTQQIFLGFLIDTVAELIMIPEAKILKGRTLIENALRKRKLSVKQCQQICGFLNFLGRAIVPGRAFTRRLYAFADTSNTKLRPHHHVRLTQEMKDDLHMWRKFLWHPSVFARGFIDFSTTLQAEKISMFSDALRNVELGYGGICENSWMYGQWEPSFIETYKPSIAYLELYALVAIVLNWIHRFKNKRIILYCDNQSVVQIVNNTSSSCKNCMVLVRLLVLKCLTENVRVFATYIESK